MDRRLNISIIFPTLCLVVAILLFIPVDAAVKKRPYSTGIADIVRAVVRNSIHRLIFRQTSYDSDVFRYTQLAQRGAGGLYAGESCRLTSTLCSYDDHCCSGRCLCRRWTITGEERCVRKCF